MARFVAVSTRANLVALAGRLIEERILTKFQADRLLRNKVHGLVVGRYVILDRLGAGGRGRVFRAQHRLMGRVVALKVIAPQIASRASSIARFHREMRLIGRLDHPNVIRAFDADQIGDLLYIVMEYVPGRSLDHVVAERGSLPPSEVVNYMAQAALGLEHAHERGIVHRDVKPSNLLLSQEGQIKVLDLGLSALMEADKEASFATAAGLVVGTVHFMSPEQCASDRDRLPERSLQPRLHDVLPADLPATFPGRYTGGMSCTTNPGLSDSDHGPPLGSVPAIGRSAGSIPGPPSPGSFPDGRGGGRRFTRPCGHRGQQQPLSPIYAAPSDSPISP